MPLTGAILKGIRASLVVEDEERCKQLSKYIRSHRKDSYVKHGCLYFDDNVVIPSDEKREGRIIPHIAFRQFWKGGRVSSKTFPQGQPNVLLAL